MIEKNKEIIRNIVNNALDDAEKVWSELGDELILEGLSMEANYVEKKKQLVTTSIPGYPTLTSGQHEVDTFIALVADMRESSKHLLCALSPENGNVSMLNRVYYETSALLPALAQTIAFEEGAVTEYLGDGVLALFRVDSNNIDKAIYAAHRAAKNCINGTRDIVNEELEQRYRLPKLNIGVGLAVSKALVTLVGLENAKHAKAIGECIFRATKISSGINQIYTDVKLEALWPKSSNGNGLKFCKKKINDIDSFLIQ